MTTQTVANTIVSQIGNIALSMLGADSLLSTEKGLQFKIKGSKKCNTVQVDLEADDTYTVKFIKLTMPRFNRRTGEMSELKIKETGKFDGVYVDSLHTVLESGTGLYTSIKPRL